METEDPEEGALSGEQKVEDTIIDEPLPTGGRNPPPSHKAAGCSIMLTLMNVCLLLTLSGGVGLGLLIWRRKHASAEPKFGASADGTTVTLNGVTFQNVISYGDSQLLFAGGGDRYKYGLVKVYTIAAYLSQSMFGAPDCPAASPDTDAIIASSDDKAFEIYMQFGISMDLMTEAIVEALEPRLPADSVHQTIKALEDGMLAFNINKLSSGKKIYLRCSADILIITLDGPDTPAQEVSSPGLCSGLWEMYIGADPLDNGAIKSGFEAGYKAHLASLCGEEDAFSSASAPEKPGFSGMMLKMADTLDESAQTVFDFMPHLPITMDSMGMTKMLPDWMQ